MGLWELCLLPSCLTSNTQSRAPLGAFFSESMLLGGMCICRETRGRSEHPGGFTGVNMYSLCRLGVGPQAHASCSCQCHFAGRRGRGVQGLEEMPRDGLWLTTLCCLIKAMSRAAQGVKRKPISDQQCQAQNRQAHWQSAFGGTARLQIH